MDLINYYGAKDDINFEQVRPPYPGGKAHYERIDTRDTGAKKSKAIEGIATNRKEGRNNQKTTQRPKKRK